MKVVRYEADGWGIGELALDGTRVLYHSHPVPRAVRTGRAPNLPQGIPEIPVIRVSGHGSRVCDDSVPEVVRRLGAYFAGADVSFEDVEIDLDGCTPFYRSLAAAARAVPRGEVVTYGELAALAGRPNAARAAGTFCAQNRIGVIVPCHRVVAANSIGSYGSLGLEYKRRLLELEGADVSL